MMMRCAKCGCTDFDLMRYESLMVLSTTRALFSLRCPHCGARVTSVCAIPAELRETIDSVAREMDAGMGRVPPGR